MDEGIAPPIKETACRSIGTAILHASLRFYIKGHAAFRYAAGAGGCDFQQFV